MSYNIRKIIANMQLNRRKSAFDRVLSVCHFVKKLGIYMLMSEKRQWRFSVFCIHRNKG